MFLVITRGPDHGQRVFLSSFPFSIGRGEENQLRLNDKEISRCHVRVKQRGRNVIVEDLDSKNGTYINGDKIINSTLKNGDRILVGNTELVFYRSEAEIQLDKEILKFNMLIAEEIGVQGPIEIVDEKGREIKKFKPIRIGAKDVFDQSSLELKDVKKIYEFHTNLIIMTNLEEAAKLLLKFISQLIPTLSRSALFIWSQNERRLYPQAAHHSQGKAPFLLSQRALEDVISRRQGVILEAHAPNITHPGKHRAVIPMLHEDQVICLIHMEKDLAGRTGFTKHELELVMALVLRCAPTFQTLLLRKELDGWLFGMIETMVAVVEAKDTYTRGHSERVSRYSMAIADEMRLSSELKRLLMISSICHDIGKIGVPDLILKKASLLSIEEYEEMKLHPTIGAEIITNMPNAQRFLSGVKYHHEKWDGTGYPEGLEGENIPFFGRIVAIADVFDAMVSGRAYSGFMEEGEAIQRLSEEKDLFDPEILRCFVKAYEKGTLSIKTSTKNQDKKKKTSV